MCRFVSLFDDLLFSPLLFAQVLTGTLRQFELLLSRCDTGVKRNKKKKKKRGWAAVVVSVTVFTSPLLILILKAFHSLAVLTGLPLLMLNFSLFGNLLWSGLSSSFSCLEEKRDAHCQMKEDDDEE